MNFSSRWLCAITLLVCASPQAFAQRPVITSAEIERGLSLSGPISNGYVSPAERYNYQVGPFLYLNGNPQQLMYLDYLDRADRARKFGYPMPVDPFFEAPPPVILQAEPRVWYGVGGGYGILRRR